MAFLGEVSQTSKLILSYFVVYYSTHSDEGCVSGTCLFEFASEEAKL